MKYAGTITIYDDLGNAVLERELSVDEMIDEILKRSIRMMADATTVVAAAGKPRKQKAAKVPKPPKGKKGKRACGNCGEAGHNAKTCTKEPKETDAKVDDDRGQRIKDMLKDGVDPAAISKETGVGQPTIKFLRRQMISRGEIPEVN